MEGGEDAAILEIREERVRSVVEVCLREEEVNKLVTCPCARCNGARPRCGGVTTTSLCACAVLRAVAQEIRLAAKMMKAFGVLALCALMIVAAGCARPQKYIDITCGKMPGETLLDREAAIQCQQFRQDEAATAVYNEATLLLKSYRACLEKYEQAPARAREYCGQYGKALQDIGLQISAPLDTDPSTKDMARPPPKPK